MMNITWRLVLLSLLLPAIAWAEEMTADTEVGRVDAATVTAREYVEALRRVRFRPQPVAEMREAAWEECLRFKFVQIFARELGRLAEASDEAVRAVYVQENDLRATRLARGDVIYGPKRLSWEQFRATWEDGIERDYGRQLLDMGAAEGDEYAAFAMALRRARDRARVSVRPERLLRLEATTELP